MGTKFTSVYNRFLGRITDDMYMELTPQDTIKDLQSLLISAIPGFEFPRVKLEYIINVNEENGEDASSFVEELTSEEINILAILMQLGWLQRQLATVEIIRMKYSGTDFKMTSQAAHLGKLITLQEEIKKESLHMQRLYKRRTKDDEGKVKSNWSVLRNNSVLRG